MVVRNRRFIVCVFVALVLWGILGTYFDNKHLKKLGWNITPSFMAGKYTSSNGTCVDRSHVPYQFNCSNINQIKIIGRLGIGMHRVAFLGVFQTRKVVVKMINGTSTSIDRCLKSEPSKTRRQCARIPLWFALREILSIQQLKHPSLPDLLGFCVRGQNAHSLSLRKHGVITVYDYVQKINLSDMPRWSLSRRLDTAIQLVDLYVYAEHSPLGYLKLSDMKPANFVIVGPYIKYIDLEQITSKEPGCITMVKGTGCEFNLTCVDNHCAGFNAIYNMQRMEYVFLRRLLRPTDLTDPWTQERSRQTAEGINKMLYSLWSDVKDTAAVNNTDIYRKLFTIRNLI